MKHRNAIARSLALGVVLSALFVAAAPAPALAIEESPGNLVGIDVSHWQGKIIWREVAESGVDFAFAKATEGQSFVDDQYARNKSRAVANGIHFSAYHFARPDRTTNDAVREADHFLRTAALSGNHILPVLDIEVTGGLGPKALIRWVKAWLGRVNERLGVKALIYTSPSFWQDNLANSRWFADNGYPLWIAHWHTDAPWVPAANWGGQGWTFWQRSNCGSVPGIEGCVDVDWHRGTDIERLRLSSQRTR